MPEWKIENFDRLLVVEGYSDKVFYAEFLEHLGKHGTVFIQHFNGKGDLMFKLDDLITPQLLSEKVKIGVMVDGNGNPAGAFMNLRNKLTELTNQTVPATGSWTGGLPDIGIFITPDGMNNGEIETLVWRAWSADPVNVPAKNCVEQYRNCMAAAGYTAQSPDKGLISTLLAIRYDDDPRLGCGARAKVFDFNHPEFDALRDFLSAF